MNGSHSLFVGGGIQIPASDLNSIGCIVQCVQHGVDIGSVVPWRPEPGNRFTCVIQNPLVGNWREAWSLPSNDFICDRVSVGLREGLFPSDHLDPTLSRSTRDNVGDTHLVHGHSKRMDVALFRRVTVLRAESEGIKGFRRGHVPDRKHPPSCIWGRGVQRDGDDPIVGEERVEIGANENVRLCGIVSGSQ